MNGGRKSSRRIQRPNMRWWILGLGVADIGGRDVELEGIPVLAGDRLHGNKTTRSARSFGTGRSRHWGWGFIQSKRVVRC